MEQSLSAQAMIGLSCKLNGLRSRLQILVCTLAPRKYANSQGYTADSSYHYFKGEAIFLLLFMSLDGYNRLISKHACTSNFAMKARVICLLQ